MAGDSGSKAFRLAATDIRPIVEGHDMCVATDRITVDGQPVGHMYRETGAFAQDSGWRFTAATETDEYGNDPDHWGIHEVNTIANYDGEIVPFLDAPVGSRVVRWPAGSPLRLATDIEAGTEAGLGPGTAQPEAQSQRQALGSDWWIDLTGQYSADVVNGAIQLVAVGRPPRVIWADIWKPPTGDSAGAEQLAADIRAAARPSGAVEFDEPGSGEDEIRIGYWCEEASENGQKHWTLYAYTIRATSFVQAAFVSPAADPEWALAAWRSMRCVPAG